MGSVNKVWVPVVPNTRGFRKEVLAFLKTVERSIELTVRLALDDGGLGDQMRRQQQKLQRDADRDPVKVPVKPTPPADVINDTWRRRLKSELDKSTAGLEAMIPAGVDGERLRRQLRDDYQAAVRGLDAEIPVDAVEADRFRHHVDELVKKISGRHAEINADADTAAAEAQLRLSARDRRVEFIASVSKKSLAGVATFLSAVSGARVAGDAIEGLAKRFQNLDQAVPKAAALSLAIGSIGAAAVSSVGGIVTLATSLAPLAALAAPLPGFLLAGGTAMAVFSAALADGKDQLAELAPLFAQLQDGISDGFWADARQPILDLVQNTFPALQDGLNDVAASLGRWAGSVASSFEQAFSPQVIGTITGALAKSIDASTRGTDAFAASIAQLGVFSAQYLPGLGAAFSDLAIQFNGWLADVVADGRLNSWVQDAIGVLKELGSIVGSTVGIIGDISRAAARAGSSGLTTLAEGLQRIDDLMSTPAFQGALETIFAGAGRGAAGLANGLNGIGRLLEGLSGSIATAFDVLGTTAGDLLNGIADALNQPVVAQGIVDAVNGIAEGVQGLLPSLPQLGELLGQALSLFGDLAATIGPVLGEALSAVAPLFSEIVQQIGPLARDLGPILVELIKELAPVFSEAAKQIGPLAEKLFPVLVDAAKELVPVIAELTPTIVQLLPQLVALAGVLLDGLGQSLPIIIPLLGDLLTGLGPALVTAVTVVAEVFQALTDFWNGDFAGALQSVKDAVQAMSDGISANVTNLTNMFVTFFGSLPAPIQNAIAQFAQLPVAIGEGIARIGAAFALGITQVVLFVQNLGSNISSGLQSFGRFVSGVASGISGGFSSAWATARSIVSTTMSTLGSLASSGARAIGSAVQSGIAIVPTAFRAAFSSLGSTVSSAIGTVRGILSSLPGIVSGSVGNLGGILVGAGRSIIDGLVRGIQSAIGAVRATLASVTNMIPEWKGPPRTDARLLVGNGRLIMGGLISGIKDRTGDLRSTLRDVTASIPNYGMSASFGDDVSAGALAFPDGITLVDRDGSILAHTRVIASDAVSQGNQARSQQLSTGINRRYAG